MRHSKHTIRIQKSRRLERNKFSRSKRYLTVTEGTTTEPKYFSSIMHELGIDTVMFSVIPSKGTAPINVVRTVEHFVRNSDDGEFADVYCVFDHDNHATYDEALKRLEKLSNIHRRKCDSIQAIPSIPCFEYWYLLHIQYRRPTFVTSPSPCKELIKVLKNYPEFKDYDKNHNEDFFTQLNDRREHAVKNAKRVLEDAKKLNERRYHEDPSTRVYKIVETFQKFGSKFPTS